MASVSKPRPKRFRILKRKPKARLFEWDLHHQWLWAAYRNGKGNFATDVLPEDLSREEFDGIAARIIASIEFPYLMEGHVEDKGVIPVGLAAVDVVEKHVEPHFHWFWWATPRNKYEVTFKFFDKLAEDAPFVIAVQFERAEPGDTERAKYLKTAEHLEAFRMAEHMKAAGIMRRVGTSHNWEPNKIMAIYETRDG